MENKHHEQRVFRYLARYGQHPASESLYRDAIVACQNIENLELTISDIARKFDLNPECLRNQLKRHFPEILSIREKMREMLGYSRPGNHGLKQATVVKYARAVKMLRDSSLTIREVASRCNVPYQGLQQHLIFYHKDIAESRMLFRTDALLQTVPQASSWGAPSAVGGVRRPREETVKTFAPAVKLYLETSLSIPKIASLMGLNTSALSSYLKRWYPDYVEQRRKERKERIDRKKEERAHRPDRSGPTRARLLYTPAIELLLEGRTLSQTAKELGVEPCNLSDWLRRNHPEVLEKTRSGMMALPSGQKTMRRTYDRFLPLVEYISSHPSKSTKELSEKFNIPLSSIIKYVKKYYPDLWTRHCKACAKKAQRIRH